MKFLRIWRKESLIGKGGNNPGNSAQSSTTKTFQEG